MDGETASGHFSAEAPSKGRPTALAQSRYGRQLRELEKSIAVTLLLLLL